MIYTAVGPPVSTITTRGTAAVVSYEGVTLFVRLISDSSPSQSERCYQISFSPPNSIPLVRPTAASRSLLRSSFCDALLVYLLYKFFFTPRHKFKDPTGCILNFELRASFFRTSITYLVRVCVHPSWYCCTLHPQAEIFCTVRLFV